jgi:hypothetical protein
LKLADLKPLPCLICRNCDYKTRTYNRLFVRVRNTQTTHSGRVYDQEFAIDYNSFERNGMMVFSAGYYEQKHIYTAWGDRMERFTERGNWDRLLYVYEDIMGNTRYYTKDSGQSFAELEYDVWGVVTSPSMLVNNDNGNFAAAVFTGHPYDTVLDIYFAEPRACFKTNKVTKQGYRRYRQQHKNRELSSHI